MTSRETGEDYRIDLRRGEPLRWGISPLQGLFMHVSVPRGEPLGYVILPRWGIRVGGKRRRRDMNEGLGDRTRTKVMANRRSGERVGNAQIKKKCRFLCEKVEFYEKCCNFDATK